MPRLCCADLAAARDGRAVPWENLAQVVSVRRSRLEPAMVQVAAVVKDSNGSFVDRVIRCPGKDLDGELVFYPWPKAAAEQGSPSQRRWVQDRGYETAEGAMQAATEHLADPDVVYLVTVSSVERVD